MTFLVATFFVQKIHAELTLSAVFSDHMVLQRDQDVRVWGSDRPGQAISVTFQGKQYATIADTDGSWSLKLDPSPAVRIPQTLAISGSSSKTIEDVLVGEVWLCSGQSNMWWPVERSLDGDLHALSASRTELRLLTIPNLGTQEPQATFDGKWAIADNHNVNKFSAIAYHFGCLLQDVLGVPVGLIGNAWGGSAAEAWVKRDLLENDPRFCDYMSYAEENEAYLQTEEAVIAYKAELKAWEAALEQWERSRESSDPQSKGKPKKPKSPQDWLEGQHRPGNLYNGMLHPIMGYGIKGVIWYQGEANSKRAGSYHSLFSLLIEHWRNDWKIGEFPFYWVQLADYREESHFQLESTWAELREAQTDTLNLSNTGQAVIIDLGEGNSIHPKNKESVANRLARIALARDYSFDISHQSPRVSEVSFESGKASVSFNNFGSTLTAHDTDEIKGFAIRGKEGGWITASGKIVASDQVEVWNDAVPRPTAVRYAWADNPICNLTNAAGLPATPFRSDR